MILHWLDLVGTFAFAFLGARMGIALGCNVLGVMVYASLMAVGGGTIREVLLGHTPFYLYDRAYVLAILLAVVVAMATYKRFAAVRWLIAVLDAVGFAAFAFIGAQAAVAAGLGLVEMIFFAVLTACGGGMLCDALAHRPPRAFHDSWYTAPSALIGYTCWLMGSARSSLISLALVAGGFALQLIVEHRQYRLKLRQFTRFTGRWRPTQQLLDTEAEA